MTDLNYNYNKTDTSFWKSEWSKRSIGFHRADKHYMLEKHFDRFINNRTKCKILFPLCGKAVDMAWFASLGHEVVGIELVETAVQEFFTEQNIPHTSREVQDFKVYESTDKSVKIYVGDLFKFNSSYEGKFNALWDRGSLVAILPTDRQKYSEIILELLAPDCVYLLDTFEYDPKLYPGPPHYVSQQQINELYGKKLSIELIDEKEEENITKRVNSTVNERVYLLKVL